MLEQLLSPPAAYDLVVIGGSAGGIPALTTLLSALPADFAVPILVVQHLAPKLPSQLPAVLGCRTALTVKWAENGELLRPGRVYVAPPDRHLAVARNRRVVLSSAEKVGWWRPAADVLFKSAAEAFGERVIAVVLSGAMWDGAKGIRAVGAAGGVTIAQAEKGCGYFEMPAAALDLGRADLALSPRRIAAALQVLVH